MWLYRGLHSRLVIITKPKKNPICSEANFYCFTCLKWVSACLATRECSQSLVPEGWQYMRLVVLLVCVVCSVHCSHLGRVSEDRLLGQTSMIIMLLCKSWLGAIVLVFVCNIIILLYRRSCKLNHLKCFLPSISGAIQK